ncbi:MAG: YbaB/EbfC family nucleoid-associated protein [Actinomycetota bacterium]|nr:YbaB/EbfC family nucleoid-associated protein [Actinomycetota bacterium]
MTFGTGGAGDLFARLQSLQGELASAQEAAGSRVVAGSSADGAVRIEATGELSFTAVHLDASVIDPADPSLLEDLLLAALRDLATKLEVVRRDAMGSAVTSALGGLFGSLADLDEATDLEDEDADEADDVAEDDLPPELGR